jgi:hypothetical protein
MIAIVAHSATRSKHRLRNAQLPASPALDLALDLALALALALALDLDLALALDLDLAFDLRDFRRPE